MDRLTERQRQALAWIGVAAGLAALNYAIVPLFGEDAGSPGLLLSSAYFALSTALTAAALILLYRTAKFINFAQIALGGMAAALIYNFAARHIVPYLLALPIALALGAVVGVAVGTGVVMLLFRHPRLVLMVATILLGGLLAGFEGTLHGAFIQPAETPGSVPQVFGPFPDTRWIFYGFPFRIGHLIGFLLSIGSLVGLAIFFRRSRVGIAIRASAENPERASLLGINVKLVNVIVWGICGLFAAIAATNRIPVTSYQSGSAASPELLLVPLAAAVIGRMTSIPTAVGAAFTMEMARQVLEDAFGVEWIDLVFFGIILAGLMVQRHKLMARQVEGTTWRGIAEIRPTPRALDAVRAIGVTRRAVVVLLGVLALAYPWIVNAGETNRASYVLIVSLIALSLLILTGWTGQISLGHFALVAIGAVVSSVITMNWGWPFWVAVPIASALGATAAFLVGIPALRIRGLFLAITTFALGIALPTLLFDDSLLGETLPDEVARPKLLFVDFASERSYYYLVLGFAVAILLMVRSLRRSRTGRVLIAIREDEQGAQSFGIDVVRARLSAFALSGAIAGLAGALFAHHQLGLTPASYGFGASLQIFTTAVIGGLGTLAGPVLGVLYFQGVGALGTFWVLVLGFVPIVVVLFVPGGLAQIVFGIRDGVLRVIAMRRHIIVPSLFTDYSPEAWEKRLAPLSPAMPNRGLAALGPEQRYSLASRLWGQGGRKKEGVAP